MIAMYWELGFVLSEYRIMESKLRFIHHLVHLDEKSIAFKVFEEQKKMKCNSLYREGREFLAILNLKENDIKVNNKKQWARMLRQRVMEKNRSVLLDKAKEYKKIDFMTMKEEEFELKNYFKEMTLKDSRTKFSVISQTTMTVKSHCMSDKENARVLWQCPEPECKMIDSISHIKTCENYANLRLKHNNLETEIDEIHYFQDVISYRNEAKSSES